MYAVRYNLMPQQRDANKGSTWKQGEQFLYQRDHKCVPNIRDPVFARVQHHQNIVTSQHFSSTPSQQPIDARDGHQTAL